MPASTSTTKGPPREHRPPVARPHRLRGVGGHEARVLDRPLGASPRPRCVGGRWRRHRNDRDHHRAGEHRRELRTRPRRTPTHPHPTSANSGPRRLPAPRGAPRTATSPRPTPLRPPLRPSPPSSSRTSRLSEDGHRGHAARGAKQHRAPGRNPSTTPSVAVAGNPNPTRRGSRRAPGHGGVPPVATRPRRCPPRSPERDASSPPSREGVRWPRFDSEGGHRLAPLRSDRDAQSEGVEAPSCIPASPPGDHPCPPSARSSSC